MKTDAELIQEVVNQMAPVGNTTANAIRNILFEALQDFVTKQRAERRRVEQEHKP